MPPLRLSPLACRLSVVWSLQNIQHIMYDDKILTFHPLSAAWAVIHATPSHRKTSHLALALAHALALPLALSCPCSGWLGMKLRVLLVLEDFNRDPVLTRKYSPEDYTFAPPSN